MNRPDPARMWGMGTAVALCLLSIFALASCGGPRTPPTISFPADGATFQEGDAIRCIADRDGTWSVSGGETLGSGASVSVALGAGDYSIRFTDAVGLSDTVGVTVRSSALEIGQTAFVSAKLEGARRTMHPGLYAPFVFSVSDSTRSLLLEFENAQPRGGSFSGINESMESGGYLPPRLEVPIIGLRIVGGRRLPKSGNGIRAEEIRKNVTRASLGDKRVWRMADPAVGVAAPGFELTATLKTALPKCDIWLDDESSPDEVAYQAFVERAASIALPRAKALWGESVDLNGDGSIAILVSGKLNSDNIAIGFFNPCDYFPREDNAVSEDYNPTSNEIDVIYLGSPDASSAAFAPASLAATVAHEYQHLARFGKKTYLPILAGNNEAAQEDASFDEGMAHLTESLVGYGLSGGNALFAMKYLSSPQIYSLRGYDSDGSIDSAGKRGGNALFFSWLLEKAGGIRWDEAQGTALSSSGSPGLEFLNESMNAELTGWDSVPSCFGKSREALFRDYLVDQNLIMKGIKGKPTVSTDALTGEPAGLNAWLGVFVFNGSSYELAGPTRVDPSLLTSIPTWSAAFVSPVRIAGSGSAMIESNEGGAKLFLGIARFE